MGFSACRTKLDWLFERGDGGGVLALIRKRCAERREGASVLGIDQGCYLENGLRLGPSAEPQIQNALQIQDIGVSRSEAHSFAKALLRIVQVVREQGLQSLIED